MADALQFPQGFIWGTATAAYQIEGAVEEGGRSESIWDAFARTPGKTLNGDTGEVACDHYHRFEEDVQHMKRLGLKHYRFSIAWPRIIPGGMGPVNHEAIRHYNEFITELLENGIEPMVTLYHWDLPLALQVEYDGWLGGQIVQDAFVRYARVCFEYFGPRVKTWITLNEPWCSALLGHGWGIHAPGRRMKSQTEAYEAGHNLLLAHAKAVDLYRREFKPIQRGKIGITLNCDWSEPKPSEDPVELQRNEEAAARSLDYFFGWFADPIYKGDYPAVMRERASNRLPTFTDAEKKLLLNSSDFLGLNSYSTRLVSCSEAFLSAPPADGFGTIDDDAGVDISLDEAWPLTDMGWAIVPEGFEKLLLWIHKRYAPPGGIYVTENGCACPDATRDEALNDDSRVAYFKGYIAAMHRAIQQGVDVKGYYAWSLLDNFEWAYGYSKRFGLLYVDYETQERVPKKSAHFFSELAQKNALLP